MDTLKRNQASHKANGRKSDHVGAAASDFLNEGKKFANEVYKEGKNQVGEIEDNMKEYSDQLLKKVQENPLTSILIAGGVGFLLSTFFKK